jgi:hypothetical protein
LEECIDAMRRRFAGSFDALTKMGADYVNRERFKPLRDRGKPLWEFKEHDHRLYCAREVNGKFVQVILFNGWSKDKDGRTKEEDSQIATAQSLLAEYQEELKKRRKP